MPCVKINNGVICCAGEYKAGDQPPESYLDWHEWASVQHKAGLKQCQCPACGKWKYPQEMSNIRREYVENGITINPLICNKCVCVAEKEIRERE